MIRLLPAALTQGPAPPPLASPVTVETAGVRSGYSLSGRLYPSAKAWVGITGVSMYWVWPGMKGVS
jgi:hypothetical protein